MVSAVNQNAIRRHKWTRDYIARSKRFVACFFLGVGQFDKRCADTLDEARKHSDDMLVEYSDDKQGRGVMIYAVTPDHLSIHVETRTRRRSAKNRVRLNG